MRRPALATRGLALRTDRAGMRTVIIDDSTGGPSGIPLNLDVIEAMKKAGLPLAAPSRGD